MKIKTEIESAFLKMLLRHAMIMIKQNPAWIESDDFCLWLEYCNKALE
jgi:hypothetical protein